MSEAKAGTPRFIVGIDLGTTHTVAAFADLKAGARAKIQLFPIEQSIQPGQVAARPLLPSARYQAGVDEITSHDLTLPWGGVTSESGCLPVIGELARVLGTKTPGHLIVSAKSWLSHPGVDHHAAILPWSAPEQVIRISPVEASASYIQHLRKAWNDHYPDFPLEHQDVVVTVPASFDEIARSLTLEAANQAGLSRLVLLEEPQAVCYDWLWEHRKNLADGLADVGLLLVVDVGGGTTDLTLIKVEQGGDEPTLTRIAVGHHLMLGGDNIDLGLAHLVEQRLLGGERRLSAGELSQLLEQSRQVKEKLLASDAPESLGVTILGTGSRLVGSSKTIALYRDEVHSMVLDGYFPLVEPDQLPDRKRSGVVEFGLPFAQDPAITRHLAAFLHQHQKVAAEALGVTTGRVYPDALLLNGGVFRSPMIARRVRQQLETWRGEPIKVLRNDRPEQAVAFGAVAFGRARRGHVIRRIGGGSARSYYLLVESATNREAEFICLLPKGAQEGTLITLDHHDFLLKLGSPVSFNLVSTIEDYVPEPGELRQFSQDDLELLPPLAVALDHESGKTEQAVRIAASLTEIGTLDLFCLASDDGERRWKIEFQLRQTHDTTTSPSENSKVHGRAPEARQLILQIYGKKSKDQDTVSVKELRNELTKMLGSRESWDSLLLRELFDALLEGLPHRRRSPDHERIWLSLCGFCLRPGFGFALDEWRVGQLFAIYPMGLQFVNETRNWAEWWTLWRRVAGGLSESSQQTVFNDIAGFIDPDQAKKGKMPAMAKLRNYEEMVRLSAVLERLPVQQKIELGNWLLQRLTKTAESSESWWALGRIGNRVPLFGSIHLVIPRQVVEAWLENILTHDFRKHPHTAFAAAMLARKSGDRDRDIDPAMLARVVDKLKISKVPESWISMVIEVKELTESDQKRLFGENLPPGLKLIV